MSACTPWGGALGGQTSLALRASQHAIPHLSRFTSAFLLLEGGTVCVKAVF